MHSNPASHLAHHPYQAGDRMLLLNLVRARIPENLLDYPSLNDWGELLAANQKSDNIHLWKDGAGNLAGYAFLNCGENYASLTLETAKNVPLACLGREMLAWAEQAYLKGYRGLASGIGLTVRASRADLLALLEGCGFVRQPDEVLRFSRSLREPIPVPALPSGYLIRPLAGEAEAPAWVALHRAAFGTANMTLEYKLAMMRQPDYDPALDLVAVSPDGSLAAYVVCWMNCEENEFSGRAIGYTDPAGTHPLHQGKGLCRTLLLSGLSLLQQRGMDEARLGTGSENLAMQRAASAAGYLVKDRLFFYEKEISAQ